ncbi:hypothetical protein M3I53_31910 [Paraburkholderia sp. CNPSo 3272]|uniref:hypothetical protein n=1 Tax=Paraburkholderia sp. CNPSo 3272 TaxID=2940931 RepID=UPI0020B80A70|nr:hypothetical protein [Paraburkholderia sp. CNPSo 3272]MCP3727676.1 hypothetical protein [Paraburkholderia sp. CNPSo 3272]
MANFPVYTLESAPEARSRHFEACLPADEKLAALSHLARTLIDKRERLDAQDVASFTAAGFAPAAVRVVIVLSLRRR